MTMRYTFRWKALALAACTALAAPALRAQHGHGGAMRGQEQTQQQMQHMQQHMAAMQDMMKRVDGMTQRSQQMSQRMAEQMRQSPPGAAGDAAGHQRMMETVQQMGDHMAAVGARMRGMMEQMQALMRDETVMRDRATQRDLDELQGHMTAMTGDMERVLRTMEGMNRRLGPHATPPAGKP